MSPSNSRLSEPSGVALKSEPCAAPPAGRGFFATFAARASDAVGSWWAFLLALATCILWAFAGPYYGYSDTWQLVINTGTTVLTFLIVFLIQYSQNRDAIAIQLKLDELLRAVEGARTGLVDLETRSDAELQRIKAEFTSLSSDDRSDAPVADAEADASGGRGPSEGRGPSGDASRPGSDRTRAAEA